jgi:hypothetical protein
MKPEARRSEARRGYDRVERYLQNPNEPEFYEHRLKKLISEQFGVSAEAFRIFIMKGHPLPKSYVGQRAPDGSRPISIETHKRAYARPSYLALNYIRLEFPLTNCIHRGLDQERVASKHAIIGYVTFRRNAETNIYRARYMRVEGQTGISRKRTLRNPFPHLLGRDVLNTAGLGIRGCLS